MKRSVMAVLISASLYAAAAAGLASCTWLPDFPGTQPEEEEPGIPMNEVLDVWELVRGEFPGDTVWVHGIIVGGLKSDGTIDFGCAGEVLSTAVILADEAGCTDPDECMALQLTKKAHKEALNMNGPDRDGLLHHGIYVRGKVTTYKKLPALTNLCDYKLE